MTKELLVAVEIVNSNLVDTLSGLNKKIPGVRTQPRVGNLGEKGPLAARFVPDIILIDDSPGSGELLTRVRRIKDNFPQTAVFVISANKDPQNIIDVMKAGAAEYLVEPVSERSYHNAVEEVRTRLANAGRLAQGSIYSFISAKGGVGATVLAVNTAATLALQVKTTTALMDMSLESGDTSVLLDVVPQTTIHDICQNIQRLDVALLRGVMIPHGSGLSFLAAPQNPEDADDIRSDHVASLLDLARKLYDHVVVDCRSMHVSDSSVEVFRRSDKVFVVTDMSVPSIRNTVRLCKLIHKFGIGTDKVEIVINRFIKDSVLSIGEIEKNFGRPVYWMFPNDFSDIVTSINRGVPLVKLAAGSPFSKNLLQFVRKFQNQLDDPGFRGIRGMFGKAL